MTIERRNELIAQVDPINREILNNVENGYAIYQLSDEASYMFMGWGYVTKHNVFNKDDYNCLWAVADDNINTDMLEDIFFKFNAPNRPNEDDNYYGTSLSVSDIVVIKRNGVTIAYYVDIFGFKKVENFI